MPNTGKPSRDCNLCRSRRVKCDLGRPQCQRCIRYGVKCPGYRDQQQLMFRDVNPTIPVRRKRQSQRQRRVDSGNSTSVDGDDTASQAELGQNQELYDKFHLTTPGMMSPSIQQHWTVQSVPILLNVYSSLSIIDHAFRRCDDDGPLMWAAHLFSRTYVTNVSHSSSNRRNSNGETSNELGNCLSKTLQEIRSALETKEGAKRDDILVTVWILAQYELLIGALTQADPPTPWHFHSRGLYSLLKARGTSPLYTKLGRAAFWPAYNMVQINALISNIACPPETAEWFRAIRSSGGSLESYALHSAVSIAKIARLVHRIITTIQTLDFDACSDLYPAAVRGMAAAEKDFNNFLAGSTLLLSQDRFMKNMQRSAVIKGRRVLELLINYLGHDPDCPIPLSQRLAQRSRCSQKIRGASQDILDSVPETLGGLNETQDKSPKQVFDSFKLLWPLTMVYVVDTGAIEQKRQAAIALTYIGKQVGVRQALIRLPGPSYVPFAAPHPMSISLSGLEFLPPEVRRPVRRNEGDCD